MRVYNRSHSPGHDKDDFTLHNDIRQRTCDQEVGGTSSEASFPHVPTDLSFAHIVLEGLHLFFSWRYFSVLLERFPCSSHRLESGLNFVFDLAMQ